MTKNLSLQPASMHVTFSITTCMYTALQSLLLSLSLLFCSGQPVAYHIYPAPGPCLLAQPDSAVARRALFTTKNLWVTPYQEGQLYPAGKYVFQSWQDSGLAQWTKQVGGMPECVLHNTSYLLGCSLS
jgi:Cu2+-containing amine oxidase